MAHINLEGRSQYVRLAALAVGLDHKGPYYSNGRMVYRAYRNRYTVFPSGSAFTHWEELVARGLALSAPRDGKVMYWLTQRGLSWLGDALGIRIWEADPA